MVYGASGFTGGLIADALLSRGHRPVLAGRDATKLSSLGAAAGLECRAASIEDLAGILEGIDLLILAVGSFASTAGAVADACVRRRCHYLDVSGEYASILSVQLRHAFARARGVMLMPACGFDVVASDCLAADVARRDPAAQHLRVAISGLRLVSRGSARTLVEQLGRPVVGCRSGTPTVLESHELEERTFEFPGGSRRCIPATWGDVATASITTGIPDVSIYFAATTPVRATTAWSRSSGAWLRSPWMQWWLRVHADMLPDGPDAATRSSRQVEVVVETKGARARMRGPEAYTFTARSTALIAERVLSGDFEPGYQTPGRVYGPSLLDRIEGVVRVGNDGAPLRAGAVA
jgi:short subunit dehydrogenase-like uncharacterized protein